jgi:hypothetical protein
VLKCKAVANVFEISGVVTTAARGNPFPIPLAIVTEIEIRNKHKHIVFLLSANGRVHYLF